MFRIRSRPSLPELSVRTRLKSTEHICRIERVVEYCGEQSIDRADFFRIFMSYTRTRQGSSYLLSFTTIHATLSCVLQRKARAIKASAISCMLLLGSFFSSLRTKVTACALFIVSHNPSDAKIMNSSSV